LANVQRFSQLSDTTLKMFPTSVVHQFIAVSND
jgi:hypothetical protein